MQKENNYDWDKLIQDHKQSNMGMKGFCIANDIPYSRFKNHVYRAREANNAIQFIPVEIKTKDLIKITINGYDLSIDSSIDDSLLRRILKALSL